jgi:predicted metalloprotease with PDZ domain
MRHFRSLVLLALICGLAASWALAQTSRPDPPAGFVFTVSMPQPHTHLFEVEMRPQPRGASALARIDLVMPAWTPGSYLVRDYARHVQDFAATDNSGAPLRWSKVNKNTWRVETEGAADWRVTYRVYANELTVRTSELNDRHAFWNNAALLMYVDGQLGAPAALRVVPPAGWTVATGLPPVEDQAHTYRAENFDILYDSPVLAGSALKTLAFKVRDVDHRIVIDGAGNYDAERVRRDVQKIVATAIGMMGDVPYRDYTFLLMLRGAGGGGLEHMNSTALVWSNFGFRPEAKYREFLGLVAHEYFHLWNVKRIRPDALGPFDYTRENYTKLLWVAEGLTSYYEELLVRRAGLATEKECLDNLARLIQRVQSTPGRRVMSLEEASFDAWIKYYRPDENAPNSQISYYDKGALVGLLLDLEIRRRTSGAKSLDDVMRSLYNEYARKGRNYTPEDFQRVCESVAGSDLKEFFNRYVRGREELDYATALSAVGLQLAGPNAAAASKKPLLGANLRQDGDRLIVANVYQGTPAYDQGLNAGDQIIALDGMRTTRESFQARLEEKRPGDTVRLTLFRHDELRTLDIRLGTQLDADYSIVSVPQPTPEQLRLRQGWLGTTQAGN